MPDPPTGVASRVVHRVQQFLSALNPGVTQSEKAAARRVLGADLYALFASMQPADQRHCLDVFEHLMQDGITADAALQAALIHDCGKGSFAGVGITLLDRVAFVLLSPFPAALALLARHRAEVAALRDHSTLTLELARTRGAAADVVTLLEEMEGLRPTGEMGRALQRADDSR